MDNRYPIGTETIAVTPSDTTTYFPGIIPYVGVTGDLAVVGADSSVPVTYPNVAVGWFPVRCKMVMANNTTASSIRGTR